jgi:DNA polymerase-3 subunit alpha
MPDLEEWPELEKLSREKEALGFYISGHPMTRYQDQIKRLASDDTLSCQSDKEKKEVGLCGMVTTLKEIRTKRGKRMAFISLEDLVGTIEVVVFNEVYERTYTLLHDDIPIYVKGNLEHSDEGGKILASEILSLERMKIQKTQSIHLRVAEEILDGPALESLKGVLHRYPGNLPTFLHVMKPPKEVTVLELPPELKVGLCEEFIQEVERLLGHSALVLH